ncbi:MAG: NAD-binding protein [Verrucomicrobia bacterium]|nr:NAD-binding protein [Verrucomicrobiota bacterium]MDA1068436.1 NAD-binding protein [Verrucomicrobiota bacterium]
MKFLSSQVAAFLEKGSSRRNFGLLIKFILILLGMIIVYSVGFHVIMSWEGQEHTWFTGFYWTLTVMSTLGFGDITFQTDVGRLFSTIVLISGIVFLLMLMPFTLIEFFYTPWMEAQARARAPRELPPDTHSHVILTNYDEVTASLIRKLEQFGYPYVVLVGDPETALKLNDDGIKVMVGAADSPETYDHLRLNRAAIVAATGTDVANTTIAFTVRQQSKDIPILTTANTQTAGDIQKLAGSTRVFRLGDMMGQALARRTSLGGAAQHIIGQFDKLLIAEVTTAGTPLVGKTLAQAGLGRDAGVTVVGVWERGQFQSAGPNTEITSYTVLVMAGSKKQIDRYDELYSIAQLKKSFVVIVGGGRVGRATADALQKNNIDFCILEKLPERVARFGEKAIIGDASDLSILTKAGILEALAPVVVVTPHDDETNIFLTIFFRKLRPDIEIISRAVLDRNVATLHRAGADFVMSYASMGADIIFNFLKRSDILMIAEGLNIFNVTLPPILIGKSLIEADIRKNTGCTVVAVKQNGDLNINPNPTEKLKEGVELLLISDAESEAKWFNAFGKPEETNKA